jgi:hypothetical protein
MPVLMPESRGRQDEVAALHRQLLAVDGGVAAAALDDETDRAGTVPMVRRGFPGENELRSDVDRGRRLHVGEAESGIGEHQHPPLRLFDRRQDETFILESFNRKCRDLPRASRKRGGKAAKRGLSAEQIPVIVARDRRRDHRCRPAAARRRHRHGRARAGHYPASRTLLRWRCGDHRIRSARPAQGPRLAGAARPGRRRPISTSTM